jgi:hypothetical protein
LAEAVRAFPAEARIVSSARLATTIDFVGRSTSVLISKLAGIGRNPVEAKRVKAVREFERRFHAPSDAAYGHVTIRQDKSKKGSGE